MLWMVPNYKRVNRKVNPEKAFPKGVPKGFIDEPNRSVVTCSRIFRTGETIGPVKPIEPLTL